MMKLDLGVELSPALFVALVIVPLLVVSSVLFMEAYHNIDLVVNEFASGNFNLIDTGLFGFKSTQADMYIHGFAGLVISVAIYNFLVILLIALYLKKDKF
jgi:hypothetical protein